MSLKKMSQAILECIVNDPDHYSQATILPQAIYGSQKECPRPFLYVQWISQGTTPKAQSSLKVSGTMFQTILEYPRSSLPCQNLHFYLHYESLICSIMLSY
jgi:hypothetical protein